MSKYNRVHQLGFVVPDMEAAMDFYGAVYGVKRWYRPVNEPQGELFFEGRPFSDPGYDMAIGYCGKTEIELITVGKVDNLYSRYLAQNPAGGLHHISFFVRNLDAWVEEYKYHLCHWFTVDDLMYLKRGGRISAATAVLGTMLSVKPVLHMDDEGHLINMSKARGRKAAIQALAQKMAELREGYDNSTVFICHGDCIDDAQYLEQLVREKCGVKEVYINYTGAVIGSHSGPGTLALFFLGKHR